MPMESNAKMCVVCRNDCSARPRTRDNKGRYFCRDCYALVQKKLRAKKQASLQNAASRPPARAEPMIADLTELAMGDDIMATPIAMPAAARGQEIACPACGTVVPASLHACPACGYSAAAAKPMPTKSTAVRSRSRGARSFQLGGGNLGGVLASPMVIGLGLSLLFGGFFLIAQNSASLQVPFSMASGLFGLGVGIWILVRAFGENATTGLLCLCLPFYSIYFVFGVNSDSYLKACFVASFLANTLNFVLNRSSALL